MKKNKIQDQKTTEQFTWIRYFTNPCLHQCLYILERKATRNKFVRTITSKEKPTVIKTSKCHACRNQINVTTPNQVSSTKRSPKHELSMYSSCQLQSRNKRRRKAKPVEDHDDSNNDSLETKKARQCNQRVRCSQYPKAIILVTTQEIALLRRRQN